MGRRGGGFIFGPPRRGEDHPLAKLTNERARQIRESYQPGKTTLREIAKNEGVSHVSIYKVVNRLTYTDADG